MTSVRMSKTCSSTVHLYLQYMIKFIIWISVIFHRLCFYTVNSCCIFFSRWINTLFQYNFIKSKAL